MAQDNIDKRLFALREKMESAKEERARAEGALAECKKQLKQDFKVNDLKEAKALLAKMEAELQEREAELDKKIRALEAKIA